MYSKSAFVDAFIIWIVDDFVQPAVWNIAGKYFIIFFNFPDHLVYSHDKLLTFAIKEVFSV